MNDLHVFRMTRALAAAALLACLGLGPVFAAQAAKERQVLTLAYDDQDNFPFHTGSGPDIDWTRPGYVVEFLKLVGDQLKLDIKFVRYPWKRCMLLTETNEIEGAFSASYNPERLKVGRYPMNAQGEVDLSRRTTDSTYYFYRMKGSKVDWDGKKVTNLQGSIGSGSGWSISKNLAEEGYTVDNSVPSWQRLLDMLVAGRMELIVAYDISYKIDANKAAYRNVERLPIPYQSKPYYLLLSHKFVRENPELAEKIWTTIGKLRDSPRVKKIRAKYQE